MRYAIALGTLGKCATYVRWLLLHLHLSNSQGASTLDFSKLFLPWLPLGLGSKGNCTPLFGSSSSENATWYKLVLFPVFVNNGFRSVFQS